MKKTLIVAAMLLVGCTDAENATRLLKAQGYTDIEITGYSAFGCSEDDTLHTGFRAKGVNGQVVVGTVCSGLFFKNSTIRFQ